MKIFMWILILASSLAITHQALALAPTLDEPAAEYCGLFLRPDGPGVLPLVFGQPTYFFQSHHLLYRKEGDRVLLLYPQHQGGYQCVLLDIPSCNFEDLGDCG